MVTEQEATQDVEQVRDGLGSTEIEEVSEEIVEKKEETPEEKEETKEPEFTEEMERRIQSEADRRSNPYREKREADTAYIRSLHDEIKDLRQKKDDTLLNKLSADILAGDEESGVEEDKIEARSRALKEITEKVKEYNEHYESVKEVAEMTRSVLPKIDKGIADKYNLLDDNPTVKAKGMLDLISDAVHFISREKAFDRILNEVPLLKKGEEVRQKIDGFMDRYMELSDEKGRDLLIRELKRELGNIESRRPPVPSDTSGGRTVPKIGANTSTRELINIGLTKNRR